MTPGNLGGKEGGKEGPAGSADVGINKHKHKLLLENNVIHSLQVHMELMEALLLPHVGYRVFMFTKNFRIKWTKWLTTEFLRTWITMEC